VVAVKQPHISGYLLSLAHLCQEDAARPELLPVFLRIVRMMPAAIARLAA
jgi:hypothetical protein